MQDTSMFSSVNHEVATQLCHDGRMQEMSPTLIAMTAKLLIPLADEDACSCLAQIGTLCRRNHVGSCRLHAEISVATSAAAVL